MVHLEALVSASHSQDARALAHQHDEKVARKYRVMSRDNM